MITTAELKEIFVEKLSRTGSMDAALTKALWVAYKKGLADGAENKIRKELTAHVPSGTVEAQQLEEQ